MKVQLRGVRGSIPVPGPLTVKYGGNTTCHEITTSDGKTIIIDGGSGIRDLGLMQLAQLPIECSIFITHTHWDHIQGLPFYTPLFIPGNQVHIYGAFDPVYQKNLRDILAAQMEYCYFPVRETELNANITYQSLAECTEVKVGAATVTPILLAHPVLNYGYKIEDSGATYFFSGDYEPAINIYDPDDEGYCLYQEMIDEQNQSIIEFIQGADLAVLDAQYTQQEYETKKGWGHGTYDGCLQLADAANINRLILTHHDPTRTDDQLDELYHQLSTKYQQHIKPKFEFAREGMVFQL